MGDHRGGSPCPGDAGARGIAPVSQGSNLDHCDPDGSGDQWDHDGDHTHHGIRGHGLVPRTQCPPRAPEGGHLVPSNLRSPRHHALACNTTSDKIKWRINMTQTQKSHVDFFMYSFRAVVTAHMMTLTPCLSPHHRWSPAADVCAEAVCTPRGHGGDHSPGPHDGGDH